MQTIPTSLAMTNETDVRGQALLALIKKYVDFPGAYYGYRPIGAHDIAFPCVMIDPRRQMVDMPMTGKTHIVIEYMIYFYVTESNPVALVTLASSAGEALIKLFSNNALNDLGSGNSNQYKAYPGFWVSSEISELLWSANFPGAMPDGKSMRAGVLRFQIEDWLIK